MVTVRINGEGFSVRPSDKKALIKQVRGGSSARRRREQEARKRKAKAKADALKKARDEAIRKSLEVARVEAVRKAKATATQKATQEKTQKRRRILTVERSQVPTQPGLRRLQKVQEKTRILRTQRQRGKKFKLSREAKLAGLTVFGAGLSFGVGITQLPQTLISLVKQPGALLRVPGVIKAEAVKSGKLIRISPTEAVAKIGSEIILLKATSKGIKVAGKVSAPVTVRLNPKFRGIKTTPLGVQTIKKVPKVGEVTIIPSRKGLPTKPKELIKDIPLSKVRRKKPRLAPTILTFFL